MSHGELSFQVAEALLQSAETTGSGGSQRLPPAFTITISREVGALGTTVAKAVGARLNWPVYDHELVNKVAEEVQRPTFHFEGLDERPANWLENVLGVLEDPRVTAPVFVKYLVGVVRGLGAMGRCVLVGRAASHILPADKTLRARLVAAPPDRVRNIVEQLNISAHEAEKWVAKKERERIEFVRQHFGVDPSDPHLYDVVLNTSRLTVDDCVEQIAALLHRLEQRAAAGARASVR
jgi:cytidylate kinase